MDEKHLKQLEQLACEMRIDVINEVYGAQSGHPGGALSICDTLAYLYTDVLNVDPENPIWPARDRVVLSKGHTCPALYAALAEKGFFPKEELQYFRKINHMLQGHPDMKHTPGVDMSTGSLGQGISAAVGMAISAKMSGESFRVYAIVGDGELQEGQVWEASMLAAHRKLDNLTAIIDNNGLQIDGRVDEVNSPYPISDKFRAFGWHVIEADAHCFDSLEKAFGEAKTITGKPVAIIQKSNKGCGVSYMVDKAEWHGSAPNAEQYEIAMTELNAVKAKLEA